LVRNFILALALGALTVPAAAQPGGKVIHLVVPFDAGGAREVLARTFYSELGQALGQTMIVENRPGAGGAIGTASVAKAAPDGQTLIFAASSHNITALLSPNAGYDPIKDFVPVANVGMQSYVLMTSSEVPAKSVAEFIAYARANPGKLNYASPGHGSSGHLAMAYFCKLAGIDMVHIPYKSTQAATNDVLAGRSHALIVPNVGAVAYMNEPRIRLLGVTSAGRSTFLPNVPPINEQLKGYALESWFGILAPRGTPRPVVDRINAAVGEVLKLPAVLQRLHAQGVEPKPMAPDPFAALVKSDYDVLQNVVRTLGKVD